MAEIGSAMSIGTVGSNPRGYTLLIMQVMHIPLHFSTFIFYAFSENVQLYGTVFFSKKQPFSKSFSNPKTLRKTARFWGLEKETCHFRNSQAGPTLPIPSSKWPRTMTRTSFFVYLAALAVQGVGQASKWKRKKEEKIIIQKNIWKIGVVTTYLASIRQL